MYVEMSFNLLIFKKIQSSKVMSVILLKQLYDPTLIGSSADPTSEVCSPTMLALPIIEKSTSKKCKRSISLEVASNGTMSTPNFIKIHTVVS